jgi:hypothetical protein
MILLAMFCLRISEKRIEAIGEKWLEIAVEAREGNKID